MTRMMAAMFGPGGTGIPLGGGAMSFDAATNKFTTIPLNAPKKK